MITARNAICGITFGVLAAAWVSTTLAQEVKHYRFAYDQPKTTGYGIAGDLFANKLKELSNGSMLIDQYPGAQLGQDAGPMEPEPWQSGAAGQIRLRLALRERLERERSAGQVTA